MDELPGDWVSLVAVVLLLGMKHGFDADHLATIDGLTRWNLRAGHGFARYCGALFSAGHGLVVLLIAALVGGATAAWQTPAWLAWSGAWISIVFLVLLGVMNLHAVLTAPADEMVAPVGLKGLWLGRVLGPIWQRCLSAEQPLVVMAIGALFAVSFDTISQAALFALAAARFGGLEHALVLGLVFFIGMLATDAINGIWIARLIARADQIARIASRVMGLAVAAVSLLVAGLGLARMVSPAIDAWSDARELLPGAMVVLLLLLAYGLARSPWVGVRGRPRANAGGGQAEG